MNPPKFCCCSVFSWIQFIFIFDVVLTASWVISDAVHERYELKFYNHVGLLIFYCILLALSFSLKFSSYIVLAVIYVALLIDVVLSLVLLEVGFFSIEDPSTELATENSLFLVASTLVIIGYCFMAYLIIKGCRYLKYAKQ